MNNKQWKTANIFRIILIGHAGVGKTTVGKRLAESIGFKFIDLDEQIKDYFTKNGIDKPIKEILELYEYGFRNAETTALLDSFNHDRVVVATGGGTPESFNNQVLINKFNHIFFLHADDNEISLRIENDNSPDRISISDDKYLSRVKLYEKLADDKVINNDVDECVKQIKELL